MFTTLHYSNTVLTSALRSVMLLVTALGTFLLLYVRRLGTALSFVATGQLLN